MGVELGGWSFGAQFGDLNNDGNLDLYLTNGYVSLEPERELLVRLFQVAGGNSAIIADAANWPAMQGTQPLGLSAEEGLAQRRRGQFIESPRPSA